MKHARSGETAYRLLAKNKEQSLVVVALLLSIALNVWLAARLTSFQRHVSATLAVGTPVPSINGTTTSGDVVGVDFRRPAVIYFFSPDCAWCERNWANALSVARSAAARYQFVAVTTRNVSSEFAHERRIEVPILRIDESTAKAFGFAATPATLVVTIDSRVARTWQGAYVGRQGREIESFFVTKLPGLSAALRPIVPASPGAR